MENASGTVLDEKLTSVHCTDPIIPCWINQFVSDVINGTLPANKNETKKLRIKAGRLVLFKYSLYRRSYSGLLLKCMHTKEIMHVLCELHEGHCINHSGINPMVLLVDNEQRCNWLQPMPKDCRLASSILQKFDFHYGPFAFHTVGDGHTTKQQS